MQVKSIQLSYFKRFRDLTLRFTDPETGTARNLVILVGNNGSGKSTILQAIACTLGTATRRLDSPSDLKWPGFNLSLAGNAWVTPYEVRLEVGFSAGEVDATSEYFAKTPGLIGRPGVIPPSRDREATLTLREGQVRAGTQAQYYQFRGREYAKQVLKLVPEGHGLFKTVGTVFWYTEHRTTTSLTPEKDGDQPLQYDEDLLRRRLTDFMQFHSRVERNEYQLRPGQRDLFNDIVRAYATVFPTRKFEGSVPRAEIDEVLREPWFFLYDGAHQYEISEMSGGERAVFPLLFDFANWNVHNSVILIDELELHLHPPLQQALLRAIPHLGENNQFIVTTHSDWLLKTVPSECVYRLEDQS
jgi:predicted ATPase